MEDRTKEAPAAPGRFGHAQDPATDFCVEVDRLGDLAILVQSRRVSREQFDRRLTKALAFRAGGVPDAVSAMRKLQRIAAQVRVTDDAATACVYCVSNETSQKGPSGKCHWTREPHCEGCCGHICDPDWKALPARGPAGSV